MFSRLSSLETGTVCPKTSLLDNTLILCISSLTWKDFYRIESEDDTFQDVIDNLLNASIFIYLGTL